MKKLKKILWDLDHYFYKNFILSLDRKNLFIYLSQGLKNGSNVKELLEGILPEYKKDGNEHFVKIITNILYYIEDLGLVDVEAFYKAHIISYSEYNTMLNVSKTEPYKAFEFINNKTTTENNLKWAIGMFFAPVIFVLAGYVIFQPEIKDFAYQMIEQINKVSLKKIEIPLYLQTRDVFNYYLIGTLVFMFSIFYFISYLSKNNIPLLFKIFRIKEREFIINTFEVFSTLLKYGYSPIEAIQSLNKGSDGVAVKIYSDIEEGYMNGDKTMFEVLSSYGLDKSTVAYIRSGENNNFLLESIQMSLEYNKEKYEKLTKLLIKILPLAGQIAMTIALLKPIIDLIMLTTVGVLSFEV